jgi:hypothetical protein
LPVAIEVFVPKWFLANLNWFTFSYARNICTVLYINMYGFFTGMLNDYNIIVSTYYDRLVCKNVDPFYHAINIYSNTDFCK